MWHRPLWRVVSGTFEPGSAHLLAGRPRQRMKNIDGENRRGDHVVYLRWPAARARQERARGNPAPAHTRRCVVQCCTSFRSPWTTKRTRCWSYARLRRTRRHCRNSVIIWRAQRRGERVKPGANADPIVIRWTERGTPQTMNSARLIQGRLIIWRPLILVCHDVSTARRRGVENSEDYHAQPAKHPTGSAFGKSAHTVHRTWYKNQQRVPCAHHNDMSTETETRLSQCFTSVKTSPRTDFSLSSIGI